MPDTLVSVEKVSKKFCRDLRRSMAYAVADIGRDALGVRPGDRDLRRGEFWAVENVSLQARRGECVGIIGANGAGKSTLLKMLNGIVRPDRGRIRMRGRVGALIEVGAGFHPMLSGRENIYVNGAILGMGKREVARKFNEIIDFAGLPSEALDAPVKTYSSGMYVRLGFSIAAHCEPDVLLIDEVLSVGDLQFMGRCRRHIAQLIANGAAVVLVSHRLTHIESMCARCILMERGAIAFEGKPHAATQMLRTRAASPRAGTPAEHGQSVTPQDATEPGPLLEVSASSVRAADDDRFCVRDEVTLTVTLADTEPESADNLLVVLYSDEADTIVATARIPWHRVCEEARCGRFQCRFPLLVRPGSYQLVVRLRGAHEHDLIDQGATQRFHVVDDGGPLSICAEGSIALNVLDLQFPAA